MILRKTIFTIIIFTITMHSHCWAITVSALGAVTSSIAATSAAAANSAIEQQQVNAANQQINNMQPPTVIEGVIIVNADWNKIYKGYNYNTVDALGLNGQKLGLYDYFDSVKLHPVDKIKYVLLDTHRWEWNIYYEHG